MTAPLRPVEVFQVPPGSLIVLRDVRLDGRDVEALMEGREPDFDAGAAYLVEELERITGHNEFLILNIATDSSAEVIGPDDLKARLREALAEAEVEP